MKSYCALIIVFIVSCSQSKVLTNSKPNSTMNQIEHSLPKEYRVTKIDSINKVYLIYARKDSSLYKILSAKDSSEACNNIKVNGMYGFMLHSLFPRQFLGKYDLSPAALPHVDGVIFNGTGITLEKDSISDLFVADNVKGLCVKL